MAKLMQKQSFQQQLQELSLQFLCCYPVKDIQWQHIINDEHGLTWEQQQQLVAQTIGHPLNKIHAIKCAYQINFLKKLIEKLEKTCDEVHDDVYESYCHVQTIAAQDANEKYAYKHYLLPSHQAQFSLRESKSFVAEGTTGLCSWQASLALADFLLQHAQEISGKSVLELGAGTGLCGFILTRCCAPLKFCLSDGNAECVELMRENIKRNFGASAVEQTPGRFQMQQQILETTLLPWHAVEQAQCIESFKPNVLLAADVVYDDAVFPELTHCIDVIFEKMQNEMVMFLAATVRNEQTLQKFLQLLTQMQFCLLKQQVVPLEISHLYWDRSTPVEIFRITRLNKF